MLINPVRDTFVVAGAIRLHYVQWGEDGVPIVCLHGLTQNAFCFQALADDLARDHRVVAYDLRGRGDTEAFSGPFLSANGPEECFLCCQTPR